MDTSVQPSELERALTAVGELLADRRQRTGIVVVGGTAMNLLGFVERATRDVDVLAMAAGADTDASTIQPPSPLPEALVEAVATVARDLGLAEDWLNTVVASQWDSGLPPGLASRIHWRQYGSLDVGLVDRYDLIFLKLYAAADDVGPTSIHYQDLIALRPTASELEEAAAWLRSQDASASFARTVDTVIHHVKRDLA